ncbi:hypothetical protein SPRG_19189 [Saprolegnia parasitica CBS 223.65]|uniref:AAA+ ATPase domain-containing protein n=1 Tax=Saprolegnia parasitica (strain CBS 223.65) TaxID=695850 RepID=A0A067CWC0_SAPPC|nr:hypothetical protein SPRG_19189 [Saprolegnia parasitica CBS 223.65]KDO33555.1 hypothetical protein SPRG_19189 [Saprolegnia parasitica CBS 223.65]|eukprot:XP_012195615.1 hypothetical protein SPRG_19189 [Saprolegnia parasitica CBS 223.65]
MAVLEDIRDLLQAICEAPTQLPSLDEYEALLDEWRQQATAVLNTLDQQSETETMRSDLMSDTMSLFSLDPSSLASHTDAASITHLDIAVLHASPFLLRLPDHRLLPLPELNIRHEQRSLHKIFHESKRALRTMQGVMTVDSLREVLDRDVQVLHFSGHGGVVASGPDALVFEDPHATGLGQLVDARHLSSILRAGCASTSVKLVFVSSCHSAEVGRVFINAGVEHVVCARQDERVLDETSILFAQSFYHALVHGKTVPQAFEIAQTRVRAEVADESNKFLLLQHPRVHADCGHAEYAQCVSTPLFAEIPIGPYVTLTQHLHHASRPSSSLPPMPSVFLGREMELHALCSALPSQRLLTIRGSPGIGKSTCALKVGHYLAERHVYEHGVFFVSARGVQSVESLEASIRSAVNADDASSSMVHAPLSSVLHHVLLILDNMEDPYQANGVAVQSFLRQLLDACPQLRLLLTSRVAMQLPDEKIMSLSRLSSVHAVRLFLKKAPRRLQEATDFYAAPGVLEDQLRDHPLLAFLDGHPQAISLCASLLLDKTLPELTQAMVSPDASASLPPLMASLTVSVASLPSDDVRNFFALQGLFPGGGLAMDFKAMLGADFEAHASLLVRFSLLQKQYPQAKVVRDPIMLSAWTHYSGYVGGRDKFTSVHRSRKAHQEEKVQTTVAQASMLSLSTIYSTFPFISSFARHWLSTEPTIGHNLEKLCAKHFQKSIRWIYRYIGTFGPFSSAAYVLFDIQEPNLWMCLERFLEKHQDAVNDSKRELVAAALPGASDMDVNSSEDAPSSSYTPAVTTTTDDPSAELSSESSDKATIGARKIVRKKHRKSDPKLALVVADMACYFAHTLYLAGRHDGATRAATLGIGLCKQYGFRGVEANLRKLMGVILINEKKLDDAKAQFGIALILYKSTVSKIGHATAMTGVGLVHSRQGNLRGAHACFVKALTMYEWSHHVVGQLNCHQRLGHLEKKLKLGEESDVTQHYAACRRLQGDLNLHRKEDQDGLRWVGHEMSLLLEIADTHVASTKKTHPARSSKTPASHTIAAQSTVESSDESSFAKRKTYDSTRRRSSGNQKQLFPDATPPVPSPIS